MISINWWLNPKLRGALIHITALVFSMLMHCNFMTLCFHCSISTLFRLTFIYSGHLEEMTKLLAYSIDNNNRENISRQLSTEHF